jgi:fumarylacetoacetase
MARLISWLDSANTATTEFPLNNLPCGVFSPPRGDPRCGVAIGDAILDLRAAEQAGVLAASEPIFDAPNWNGFMALGATSWATFRADLIAALGAKSTKQPALEPFLHPRSSATLHMPFTLSEFTDFYAGMQHALNMGEILRGEPSLPPNWLHMPVGYNGRASSVVVSGTGIHRPWGQITPDDTAPILAPTRALDMELELGAVVGTPSPLGQPVSVDQAEAMIFGYVLLNDWSARDIQGWEYRPLGPFQSKAFATTISPWIVTSAALEPFRTPIPPRATPQLPYMAETRPGLYDITLSAALHPANAAKATIITRTNAARLYYSAAQQLCHHAIGGCAMRCGDLLGSGTISGPTADEFGSLMELSRGGRAPVSLDDGEKRAFVEDGDTITLRGHAKGDGYRIGFGNCTGTILPAVHRPDWA